MVLYIVLSIILIGFKTSVIAFDSILCQNNQELIKPHLDKPDNPPKYFAIDIDGTFYTVHDNIFDENIKALENIRDKGYTPFFCTGRSFVKLFDLFPSDFIFRTGYVGFPGVYNNGAVVYDDHGNLLRLLNFSPDVLLNIVDYAYDNNRLCDISFASLDCDYILDACYNRDHGYLNLYPFKLVTKDILKDLTITKIRLFITEMPLFKNIKYGDHFLIKRGRNAIYILPPGSNKAEGLKILMEHLGEDPPSCGFIGDYENDIEAMRFSKLSFAVDNADQYVKKSAKYVVKLTNNEAAVAYVLNFLYNNTQLQYLQTNNVV